MESLVKVRTLEIHIRNIEDEIVELETAATKITGNFSGEPVQSTHRNDGMPNAVIRILEKRDKYIETWDQLIDHRETVEATLCKMDDATLASILWNYYVKAKTWEQVAVIHNVTLRYVFKLLRFAIADYRVKYDIGH